ncbi:cleavage and polyadenylation specificity factor subunit 2 [Olea europaea var. sylvestris]|uniref:cleavage and polyadenylation specificity factor subunit 2 n=1 Tax=Olea europaea var. sylvestris TaxID=158386 RepID=UPI000C1D2D49|nr:cleavage and polyadenylation specificity factor subunit 2 [Olea europaea var. sylvestris]
MGTSVQVKPLCGVYNENPLSYLVSVDGFNFLIDCGWNDHFDTSLLQPLSRVASTVDAVLLSHPDTLHLGALPYAMKQLGLSAPVFATEPVFRLGLLTMYDQYLSRKVKFYFGNSIFAMSLFDLLFTFIELLLPNELHSDLGVPAICICPYVLFLLQALGLASNKFPCQRLGPRLFRRGVGGEDVCKLAYNLKYRVKKVARLHTSVPVYYRILRHGMTEAEDDVNGKLDEGSASLILDTTPSKVVSSEQTVYVKCSLLYMDFEGRSDGRSVKSILAHVSPLKLVLVHGSAEATEHLKQHCLKNVCQHVYAPQIEESIDVTSDLCAYKVQLSEKLMSNVLFKKLGDYEIAWVDAEVGETENGTFSLLPLSTPTPPHKTVLVGDIKMADLKQYLASKGVQVEFAGGALRCGEYVTLRKVGDSIQKGGSSGVQQIILEGPLSEEYYKIRDHLYAQFYSL